MHEVTNHHYTASTNVRGMEIFRWKSQHSVPMQQDENVQTVNSEYKFLLFLKCKVSAVSATLPSRKKKRKKKDDK